MGVLWAAAAAQDPTGRALPLAWLVRHGQQGHVPADFPMALVEQVSQLRPEGTQVVGLGDGTYEVRDHRGSGRERRAFQ